ncbi:MAG: ankyrin repeat domain-containing protein [Alphaproteobacteria bacterium]|nr:ankyrin repeat domain-containing protein [Alphaproteobacteria bacterium]
MSSSAPAADIHKAARKGDLEDVRALIANGADLSELDKAVGAALHWAAARGHSDVARELIEAGADPNQEGHGPDRLTPLHLASSGGHLALVELLVERGANLEAGNGAVGTPLHSAAQADRTDVVVFLHDAGANPAARTSGGAYGIYPLHLAAEAGAAGPVSAILDRGFPVNAVNEATGVTALHLGVFQGQPEAVSGLLEAGADPHAVSTNIETPAALAKYHPEIEELFTAVGIE